MTATSILPDYYDVPFILEAAGVTNHYGHIAHEDGIHLHYLVEDFEAVQAARLAYPVAYRAVMVPDMIHEVSQTRERKLAVFAFNGIRVPLDMATIANLTASAVGLERDPDRQSINWSLGKGQFVTLNRAVVDALAKAAFAYVNDCFDAQKAIVEEIQSAADIEVLRAIDIASHEAWPA